MFNLRIVQANFGDAFVLEYGIDASPRYSIIDGGPHDIFDDHLSGEVQRILDSTGHVDLVNVSHVHGDHITGILDLFADLEARDANGQARLQLDRLWLNSFEKTLGEGVMTRLASAVPAAAAEMQWANLALNGISEGNRLRVSALQLGVALNPEFPNDLICVDDASELQFGNLELTVVGPTRANLQTLEDEWLAWLDENGPDLASGDPLLMRNSDDTIPNLSSVMLLAKADGKTVLFTGDGRSDHLLSGLAAQGLLDGDGKLHVDVLKVMHHGSNRNVTRSFFRKVTADTYVISANGHPDNPDLDTLQWIVEGANQDGRDIELKFTNETTSVRELRDGFPENEHTYSLQVMPRHYHYWNVPLA